ncbi:MAG: hypothetical protein ACOYVG_09660 [Bacteroidota bacterium]
MKMLHSFLQKTDWILIIRLFMAILFIAMAVIFCDWLPALLGLTILVTALIAHKTKSGCGYSDCRKSA